MTSDKFASATIGGQGQGWGTVVCASAAVARGARRARSTRT